MENILQQLKKLYTFDCLLKNAWSHEIRTDTKLCQEFLASVRWLPIPKIYPHMQDQTDMYLKLRKCLRNQLYFYYDSVMHLMPTFLIPVLLNKYKINQPQNPHYRHINEFWKFYIKHPVNLQKKKILVFSPVSNCEKNIQRKQKIVNTNPMEQNSQSDFFLLNITTPSLSLSKNKNINYIMNGINYYCRIQQCEKISVEMINRLICIPRKYNVYSALNITATFNKINTSNTHSIFIVYLLQLVIANGVLVQNGDFSIELFLPISHAAPFFNQYFCIIMTMFKCVRITRPIEHPNSKDNLNLYATLFVGHSKALHTQLTQAIIGISHNKNTKDFNYSDNMRFLAFNPRHAFYTKLESTLRHKDLHFVRHSLDVLELLKQIVHDTEFINNRAAFNSSVAKYQINIAKEYIHHVHPDIIVPTYIPETPARIVINLVQIPGVPLKPLLQLLHSVSDKGSTETLLTFNSKHINRKVCLQTFPYIPATDYPSSQQKFVLCVPPEERIEHLFRMLNAAKNAKPNNTPNIESIQSIAHRLHVQKMDMVNSFFSPTADLTIRKIILASKLFLPQSNYILDSIGRLDPTTHVYTDVNALHTDLSKHLGVVLPPLSDNKTHHSSIHDSVGNYTNDTLIAISSVYANDYKLLKFTDNVKIQTQPNRVHCFSTLSLDDGMWKFLMCEFFPLIMLIHNQTQRPLYVILHCKVKKYTKWYTDIEHIFNDVVITVSTESIPANTIMVELNKTSLLTQPNLLQGLCNILSDRIAKRNFVRKSKSHTKMNLVAYLGNMKMSFAKQKTRRSKKTRASQRSATRNEDSILIAPMLHPFNCQINTVHNILRTASLLKCASLYICEWSPQLALLLFANLNAPIVLVETPTKTNHRQKQKWKTLIDALAPRSFHRVNAASVYSWVNANLPLKRQLVTIKQHSYYYTPFTQKQTKQYNKENTLIKTHINNAHLLKTVLTWKSYDSILQKNVGLHSTININEGLFLYYLLHTCIHQLFTVRARTSTYSDAPFCCLEIGCAMGMSTMFIINACNTAESRRIQYDIIDPNQDTQWHYIGLENAKKVANDNIHIQLTTETSGTAFKLMRRTPQQYHFIFIDGSHSYEDVLEDCINSHAFLHPRGLVVHDDVLHIGCRKAIQKYYANNQSYRRVILKPNGHKKFCLKEDPNPLFLPSTDSYLHPSTMYAFQKLKH